MATAQQIASLRLQINEPDTTNGYTDVLLGARIDLAGGDLNGPAYEIWVEKAASFAEMVDISEGGSSRKMGDMHEQALNMAAVYRERIAVPGTRTGTRISRLTR